MSPMSQPGSPTNREFVSVPSISVTECLDLLTTQDVYGHDEEVVDSVKKDRSMSIRSDISDRTLVLESDLSRATTPEPSSSVGTGPLSPFRTPLDSTSSCHTGCYGCFKPMCWSHITRFTRSRWGSAESSNGSTATLDFRDHFLNELELPSTASLRSSSIDISSLRRDIELLSSGEEDEESSVCPDFVDAIRPVRDRRSMSADATSRYSLLSEEPTRMERLSILFRLDLRILHLLLFSCS